MLIDYGKGFAVFGNTFPYKQDLRSMQGGFSTGYTLEWKGQEPEATPGWFFSSYKADREEVQKFVDKINKKLSYKLPRHLPVGIVGYKTEEHTPAAASRAVTVSSKYAYQPTTIALMNDLEFAQLLSINNKDVNRNSVREDAILFISVNKLTSPVLVDFILEGKTSIVADLMKLPDIDLGKSLGQQGVPLVLGATRLALEIVLAMKLANNADANSIPSEVDLTLVTELEPRLTEYASGIGIKKRPVKVVDTKESDSEDGKPTVKKSKRKKQIDTESESLEESTSSSSGSFSLAASKKRVVDKKSSKRK